MTTNIEVHYADLFSSARLVARSLEKAQEAKRGARKVPEACAKLESLVAEQAKSKVLFAKALADLKPVRPKKR